MGNLLSRKSQILSVALVVTVSVFFTVVFVYATTISADVTTVNMTASGTASSTSGFRVQDYFTVDSSGNTTSTGRVSLGGGTALRQLDFGSCNTADTTVSASSTAQVWCTGAVGITSADTNVFVMATSTANGQFIIQAASSTAEAASKIGLTVFNIGTTGATTFSGRTLRWQSVR